MRKKSLRMISRRRPKRETNESKLREKLRRKLLDLQLRRLRKKLQLLQIKPKQSKNEWNTFKTLK
jgi:hypothetical protein